jgi:diaminopropionate ammonia-lyase
MTFVTATDGNHGRGVAWTANRLKQKSVVYMPKGSSPIRLQKIQDEGAEASIEDMNYDEAVRLAAKYAAEHNGVVIQDTAWEGYQDIPTWIMQGYATMALEANEQLKKLGVERPTHIFIQAGVGSLAGAVQGFFAMEHQDNVPVTVVVEPDNAACYYLSAQEGKMSNVGGDMQTIMAGLACGEPNVLGFEIIKNYSAGFLSCPDYIAADGMRILGNPMSDDTKVVSGESGAVTMGAVYRILTDGRYQEFREQLKLDENSKILLFSTEGDTDPDKYRRIVWLGENSQS